MGPARPAIFARFGDTFIVRTGTFSASSQTSVPRDGASRHLGVEARLAEVSVDQRQIGQVRFRLERARDSKVRAAVITGAGERAFASGADTAESSRYSEDLGELAAYDRAVAEVYDAIAQSRLPVIVRSSRDFDVIAMISREAVVSSTRPTRTG